MQYSKQPIFSSNCFECNYLQVLTLIYILPLSSRLATEMALIKLYMLPKWLKLIAILETKERPNPFLERLGKSGQRLLKQGEEGKEGGGGREGSRGQFLLHYSNLT